MLMDVEIKEEPLEESEILQQQQWLQETITYPHKEATKQQAVWQKRLQQMQLLKDPSQVMREPMLDQQFQIVEEHEDVITVSAANLKTEDELQFIEDLQNTYVSQVYTCPKCWKTFKNPTKHAIHVKQNKCTTKEKCSVCPLTFISPRSLLNHLNLHRDNYFFCTQHCGASFKTLPLCEEHEKNVHKSTNPPKIRYKHFCSFCREGFKTEVQLHVHWLQKQSNCGQIMQNVAQHSNNALNNMANKKPRKTAKNKDIIPAATQNNTTTNACSLIPLTKLRLKSNETDNKRRQEETAQKSNDLSPIKRMKVLDNMKNKMAQSPSNDNILIDFNNELQIKEEPMDDEDIMNTTPTTLMPEVIIKTEDEQVIIKTEDEQEQQEQQEQHLKPNIQLTVASSGNPQMKTLLINNNKLMNPDFNGIIIPLMSSAMGPAVPPLKFLTPINKNNKVNNINNNTHINGTNNNNMNQQKNNIQMNGKNNSINSNNSNNATAISNNKVNINNNSNSHNSTINSNNVNSKNSSNNRRNGNSNNSNNVNTKNNNINSSNNNNNINGHNSNINSNKVYSKNSNINSNNVNGITINSSSNTNDNINSNNSSNINGNNVNSKNSNSNTNNINTDNNVNSNSNNNANNNVNSNNNANNNVNSNNNADNSINTNNNNNNNNINNNNNNINNNNISLFSPNLNLSNSLKNITNLKMLRLTSGSVVPSAIFPGNIQIRAITPGTDLKALQTTKDIPVQLIKIVPNSQLLSFKTNNGNNVADNLNIQQQPIIMQLGSLQPIIAKPKLVVPQSIANTNSSVAAATMKTTVNTTTLSKSLITQPNNQTVNMSTSSKSLITNNPTVNTSTLSMSLIKPQNTNATALSEGAVKLNEMLVNNTIDTEDFKKLQTEAFRKAEELRKKYISKKSLIAIDNLPEKRQLIASMKQQIAKVETSGDSSLVNNNNGRAKSTVITNALFKRAAESITLNTETTNEPPTLFLPILTGADVELVDARYQNPDYIYKWICPYCRKDYEIKRCLKSHLIKAHNLTSRDMVKINVQAKPFLNTEITINPDIDVKQEPEEILPEEVTSESESTCFSQISIHSDHHQQLDDTAADVKPIKMSPLMNKQRFVCNKCGRKCSSKIMLSDHMRANCSREPQYPCTQCPKKFYSESTLRCHVTIHTGELPHKCSYCEKRFRTRGQVTVHHRTHTGERPFVCQVCSQRFTHRETLIAHLSRHIGMKRYKCYCCDKHFSCISALKTHREIRPETCGKVKFNPRAVGPRVRVVRGNVIFEAQPEVNPYLKSEDPKSVLADLQNQTEDDVNEEDFNEEILP